MGSSHSCVCCPAMPPMLAMELQRLRASSNFGQTGKKYYATAASAVGIREEDGCLKMSDY